MQVCLQTVVGATSVAAVAVFGPVGAEKETAHPAVIALPCRPYHTLERQNCSVSWTAPHRAGDIHLPSSAHCSRVSIVQFPRCNPFQVQIYELFTTWQKNNLPPTAKGYRGQEGIRNPVASKLYLNSASICSW